MGEFVVGDSTSLVDAIDDFIRAGEEMGSLGIAQGFEFAAVGRHALGDGDEEIVAEDLAEGPIGALGFFQAPEGEPARGFEAAAIEVLQAGEAAPAIGIVPSTDRLEERGRFLFGPGDAAEAIEVCADVVCDGEEVADIIEGVLELGIGEGAASPIGAGFGA
jgi:hypothetical protein